MTGTYNAFRPRALRSPRLLFVRDVERMTDFFEALVRANYRFGRM